MPKVSIVMPAYNHGKFIVQAIESVLGQTFRDFELIVVNNGSTDDTEAVLKPYLNRMTYIPNATNEGLSRAMNTGSLLAKGEYIVWLDSDDALLPEMLSILVRILDEKSDLAFVSGGTNIVDHRNQTIRISRGGIERQKTFDDLLNANFILKPSTMVRRRLAAEIGYFDIKIWGASDYDLWLRLAKKHKFEFIDQILSKYRVHDNNMTKNIDSALQDHLYILAKPEIAEGLTALQIKIKKARVYHTFATWYEEKKSFAQAAECYKKAVKEYPFIGTLYWPAETENFRFSLPYRFLRPYWKCMKRPKHQTQPAGTGLATEIAKEST